MLFEQFEARGLAHYSYLIACPDTGEAVVVDPRRDLDVYLEFAARHQLRISHVLETHIHADYASGARELAEKTGARLMLSAYDKGQLYEVRFPHEEVREGDEIAAGSFHLKALHTPGHTPEHLAFLVFDRARSKHTPQILLSGDFLFVGSLGRPDLLGEEVKVQLARQLYASVRDKLQDLPDGLEIYPAHGAGSMCGSGMSGRPHSTLGFERVANAYLDPGLSEEACVQKILASVPPMPDYYLRMKRLNSQGAPFLNGLPDSPALDLEAFKRLRNQGALVVDLHDPVAFSRQHIPGSYGIGAGDSFVVWASWVLPPDRPVVLVTERDEEVEEAVRSLVRVGLDDVRGFLKGGITVWLQAGESVSQIPQILPERLQQRLSNGESVRVLDVRTSAEWKAGHIAGAFQIQAGELEKRLEEVQSLGRPLVLVCGSGYRATVAASLLERQGIADLWNMTGGMKAWEAAGLPEDRGQ